MWELWEEVQTRGENHIPGVSVKSFQTDASMALDSLRRTSFLMGEGSVAARLSSSSLLAKTEVENIIGNISQCVLS